MRLKWASFIIHEIYFWFALIIDPLTLKIDPSVADQSQHASGQPQNHMPTVLILGGSGFIGRHFIEYLVSNNLSDSIRVVDKTTPSIAYLNARQKKLFEDPKVEFKQANLCTTGISDHSSDSVLI